MYFLPSGSTLKQIDLSNDTAVGIGGNNLQTLTPPAGKVYQVVGWYIKILAVAGATANAHGLKIRPAGGTTNEETVLQAVSNWNVAIVVGQYGGVVAGTETPSGHEQQQWILNGSIWASADYPLNIYYYNDTDNATSQTRTIKLLVREFNEL